MDHCICILTYTVGGLTFRGWCVYILYTVVFIFLSRCTVYVSKKVRKWVCVYVCERGREYEGEIKMIDEIKKCLLSSFGLPLNS